jgi:hypothetical protein
MHSALTNSDSSRVGQLEKGKAIKLSTFGILFLATPHQGGQVVTISTIITNMISLVIYTNLNILKYLGEHSEWLQQQQGKFALISGDFEIVYFDETYKMRIPFLGTSLVSYFYASSLPRSSNF